MAVLPLPTVPLVNTKTGKMSNEWYQYFSQSKVAKKGAVADIRDFGATWNGTSYSNVTAAVNAAVAAGYFKILLPAHATYIPTANTTPANVEIIGEDWQTSVISPADRTTQNVSVGAWGRLRNVGIIGAFNDSQTDPVGIQKTQSLYQLINQRNVSQVVGNWAYESIIITTGATVTGDGVTVADAPGMALSQSGPGDGMFIATSGIDGVVGGICIRAHPQSNVGGDIGYLAANGFLNPGVAHTGIKVEEYSTNANAKSIYIERHGGGGTIIVYDDINTPGSITSNIISLTLAKQSSGTVFNLFQAQTPYSGTVFFLNMGNSTGTFTGNFLDFYNGGFNQLKVTANNGILVGNNPTGGAKGSGTINCTGDIYKQGAAFTNPDYVFQNDYALRPMDELETEVRKKGRFPGIDDEALGMFARSDILLEKLEEAYLYIFQLHHRLKELEDKIAEMEP